MVFRKWGGRPHWEYDAQVVGDDEHGTWVGGRGRPPRPRPPGAGAAPAATRLERPGAAFDAPADFVSLVPREGAFVATFYGEHPGPAGDPPIELYVDITTVPEWAHDSGQAVVVMVDLDLDVVRGRSGRVWVDDEDEFAAHRVRYRSPQDVVRLAAASCDAVHAGVVAGQGAFDAAVGRSWLTRLASTASVA